MTMGFQQLINNRYKMYSQNHRTKSTTITDIPCKSNFRNLNNNIWERTHQHRCRERDHHSSQQPSQDQYRNYKSNVHQCRLKSWCLVRIMLKRSLRCFLNTIGNHPTSHNSTNLSIAHRLCLNNIHSWVIKSQIQHRTSQHIWYRWNQPKKSHCRQVNNPWQAHNDSNHESHHQDQQTSHPQQALILVHTMAVLNDLIHQPSYKNINERVIDKLKQSAQQHHHSLKPDHTDVTESIQAPENHATQSSHDRTISLVMKIQSTTTENWRSDVTCAPKKRLSPGTMHWQDTCVWFIRMLIGWGSRRNDQSSERSSKDWSWYKKIVDDNDIEWDRMTSWKGVSGSDVLEVGEYPGLWTSFLPANEIMNSAYDLAWIKGSNNCTTVIRIFGHSALEVGKSGMKENNVRNRLCINNE